MWIAALDRKLLRETARLKGQIATIAIVLAAGIASFLSMRGTYASLESSRADYYDRHRFAHLFASVERAPESLARRVERLPSVEVVETRIAEDVTLPIEGMGRPAYGRLLSLPAAREPATNAVYLRRGRLPARGRDDEVALLESFANAHGLEPGDFVPAVVHGKLRRLRVVGIALSPEFVFAIRPGALADDPRRYAVLWMERAAVASAFQLEGAFNDLTLRLQPGASEAATRAAVDRLLAPYGGSGTFARKDQLSHRILMQELNQLQALADMVPIVFLAVAAFLINLVLARLIRLQRPEIATLKSVGYTGGQIARHYLGLVGVVMLPGGLLGVVGGWILGRLMLGLYSTAFRFPELHFEMSGSLVAVGLSVSALAAVAGALGAVYGVLKLPPAEAMQPPAPARYRRGALERLGIGSLFGPIGMMIVREILRRPLRTAFSSAGIAGAVGLLILGRFGWDSIVAYFEGTFRREQRQDLAVAFARPAAPRVVGQLQRLPGVTEAEGIRVVPIRVHHEHRARDALLMGLPEDSTLRRLVARGGYEVALPAEGVLVSKALAEILQLSPGDRPDIEVRDGERRTVRPLITGLMDESFGLQVYGRAELVAQLEGHLGAVSSVLLRVEPDRQHAVEDRLRTSPQVIDVSDARADMQRMFDTNASVMNVWTAISIALSACVVFGVVYNNARIALAARSRDLASLRVLGFTQREVASILLGGLVIEVLLAVPAGLVLGQLWAHRFMSTVDTETFRWQVVIEPRTYLLSTAVTLLAAAASALWVQRSLERLDLIGVLKARE